MTFNTVPVTTIEVASVSTSHLSLYPTRLATSHLNAVSRTLNHSSPQWCAICYMYMYIFFGYTPLVYLPSG